MAGNVVSSLVDSIEESSQLFRLLQFFLYHLGWHTYTCFDMIGESEKLSLHCHSIIVSLNIYSAGFFLFCFVSWQGLATVS